MSDLRDTEDYWRNRLPHWEVNGASLFITFRCVNSLPKEILDRIFCLSNSMNEVDAQSVQYSELQRKLFATTEKYLDAGHGFTPFENPAIAECFVDELKGWVNETNWNLDTFCVMPNHVHLLVQRTESGAFGLKDWMKRLKGRSARALNAQLQRSGSFWHTDWFDRWMRTEAEAERVRTYILNNPVKAGLVELPEQYEWSSIGRIA